MKMIKYTFGLLFALIFASCDGNVEHTIYEGDRNVVSFVATLQSQALKEGDVIRVPIYRGDNTSELRLPIGITNPAGSAFTLKSNEVVFNRGENVAYAEVDYGSIDDLSLTNTYSVKLGIGKFLSPAAIDSITLKFNRQLTFEVYGEGSFSSEFFGEEWSQPIELAAEAPVISLPDCYAAGFPIVFLMDDNLETVQQFATQPTGYVHPTYGMISAQYVSSTKIGNELHLILRFIVSAGSFGTAEEIITFPEK